MTPGDAPRHPAPDPLSARLLEVLAEQHDIRPSGPRRVVAVAGESGSGKTVTAQHLVAALTSAGIIADVLSQDDYFIRPPATNHAHRLADLTSVGPQEVDFARLVADVAAFRAGANGVDTPLVDYPGNRFVARQRDFAPLHVLVVEGTYVLAQADADVRIFLSATSLETRQRRVARNRDADDPFVERVLAIEHAIIAAQRPLADVVIDSDFQVAHQRP